jgi:hypothetical protein
MVSPAVRHYFRMETRRIWTRRTVNLSGAILLALLILQIAVTYAVQRAAPPATPGSTWAWRATSVLGFSSYIGAILFENARWPVMSGVPGWMWTWQVAWATVTAAGQTALFFLMPAFVALSIAGDREQRRTQDLMLTRLRPAELLAAKALAAAFPFLVLAALLAAGALVTFFVVRLPVHHAMLAEARTSGLISLSMLGESERTLPVWVASGILSAVLSAGAVLAEVAILASVAALCRRMSNALALCYTLVIAKGILFSLPLSALLQLLPREISAGRGVFRTVLTFTVELSAAWLLCRLAVRSLAFPDEPPVELPPVPRLSKPYGLWLGPEDPPSGGSGEPLSSAPRP